MSDFKIKQLPGHVATLTFSLLRIVMNEAFLNSVSVVTLSEMGDKTQLATLSLGAAHKNELFLVTAGTTLGMMIADGLAVALGPTLLKRVPMQAFRILAALLFLFFALQLALGNGI